MKLEALMSVTEIHFPSVVQGFRANIPLYQDIRGLPDGEAYTTMNGICNSHKEVQRAVETRSLPLKE